MFPSTDQHEMVTIPLDVDSKDADFAVVVDDHSMEPLLFEGDVLLVKSQPSVKHGELGIFMLDGVRRVKRMYLKGTCCRLVSLNIDYGDVIVKDIKKLVCQGKVIKSLRGSECVLSEI